MDVYKEEVQIVCGQGLRLRGDAVDSAVAAAKLDGWKVATAQAISAQEPGSPEDHKRTSVVAGVAVRNGRGIGDPLGLILRTRRRLGRVAGLQWPGWTAAEASS